MFAITYNRRTFNQLALAWNVFPVLIEGEEDINLVIEKGIEKHKVKGNLVSGDKVILAGGSKILPAYATSKIFGGYLTID